PGWKHDGGEHAQARIRTIFGKAAGPQIRSARHIRHGGPEIHESAGEHARTTPARRLLLDVDLVAERGEGPRGHFAQRTPGGAGRCTAEDKTLVVKAH